MAYGPTEMRKFVDENHNVREEAQEAPPQEIPRETNTKQQLILTATLMVSWLNLMAAYLTLRLVCKRGGSDEKLARLDRLATILLYSITVFISSHMLPSDHVAREIRKLQFVKLFFIVASMVLHLLCLSLYAGVTKYGDSEVFVAFALHGVGYIVEGYHMSTYLELIFDEDESEPARPVRYEIIPAIFNFV